MYKKFLSLFVLLLFLFSTGTFAFDTSEIENSKRIANTYIFEMGQDENWKNNSPNIVGEGKLFYTDEKKPSYIEYKISCSHEEDCGFVLINLDGNDVSIPMAATLGETPSEIMRSDNEKLYYFSPFEQYAEDQETGLVKTIGPDTVEIESHNKIERSAMSFSRTDKVDHSDIKQNQLKNKLKQAKKTAKKYKKTQEFKKLKKNFKEVELNKSNVLVAQYSRMATEVIGNSTYVPGESTVNCNSRIPCYKQFEYAYDTGNCLTGCTPTAHAMLFAYHDRQGTFSELIEGVPKSYVKNKDTDKNVTTAINDIRKVLKTHCTSHNSGGTYPGNFLNSLEYVKNQGYKGSRAFKGTSGLHTIIKNEINKGNPIIVNTKTHSLVAYGYNHTSNSKMVRVNYGWGNGKFSNADVNINSININGKNYALSTTVRFDIKK